MFLGIYSFDRIIRLVFDIFQPIMAHRREASRAYTKQWISISRQLGKRSYSHLSDSDSDDEMPPSKRSNIDHATDNESQFENSIPDITSTEFEYSNFPEPSEPSGDLSENREEIWENINIWNENMDSSDSEDEFFTEKPTLRDDLKVWACEGPVQHGIIESLLRVLKQHGHDELPVTARTLLGTLAHVAVDQKSGMDYVYLDLKKQLVEILNKYPEDKTKNLTEIEVSNNVDGLPLFKSSREGSWPVLFAVHLERAEVFASALTLGKSKPSDQEYLRDTLVDLHDILVHGLEYKDRTISVNLRCVVADAPAMAMIKQCKQYSGYYGCERCTQKGEWHNKVTYQQTRDLNLRTDTSFRNKVQKEHHVGDSLYTLLEMFDMVEGFAKDYMHIVCLGVVKRLILLWLRGPREIRISKQMKDMISECLIALRPFIPDLFQRKGRTLDDIDRYKATELRQLLLYTGQIVLRGILKDEYYDHFLVLNVAMAILLSPTLLAKYADYADNLMVHFVEKGRQLYGPEFLVYNVHSLLHLTSAAKRFNGLDNCSAFCFENFLQTIKRLVRSGNKPLVQIVKRLSEMQSLPLKASAQQPVRLTPPNNAFILGINSCCEAIDVGSEKGMFRCRVYDDGKPLYTRPCDSRIIGVMTVRRRDSTIKMIPADQLTKRAMRVEQDSSDKLIFLAILHDY